MWHVLIALIYSSGARPQRDRGLLLIWRSGTGIFTQLEFTLTEVGITSSKVFCPLMFLSWSFCRTNRRILKMCVYWFKHWMLVFGCRCSLWYHCGNTLVHCGSLLIIAVKRCAVNIFWYSSSGTVLILGV